MLRPHGGATQASSSIPPLVDPSLSIHMDPMQPQSTTERESVPSAMMIKEPPIVAVASWLMESFGNHLFLNLHHRMLDKILKGLFGDYKLPQLVPFTPIQAIEGLGKSLCESSVLQLVELNIIFSWMQLAEGHCPLPIDGCIQCRADMHEQSKTFHTQVMASPKSIPSGDHSKHSIPSSIGHLEETQNGVD